MKRKFTILYGGLLLAAYLLGYAVGRISDNGRHIFTVVPEEFRGANSLFSYRRDSIPYDSLYSVIIGEAERFGFTPTINEKFVNRAKSLLQESSDTLYFEFSSYEGCNAWTSMAWSASSDSILIWEGYKDYFYVTETDARRRYNMIVSFIEQCVGSDIYDDGNFLLLRCVIEDMEMLGIYCDYYDIGDTL